MSDTPSRFRIGDQVVTCRAECPGVRGWVVDIHNERIVVVNHGSSLAHYWDYELDLYCTNTESDVQPIGVVYDSR
jgi:hypothetical protein